MYNYEQKAKKKNYLSLIIFIILFLGISGYIIIPKLLEKKEESEPVIEKVIEEYSWSGIYSNGEDTVKIYQIDENKLYFDINTEESRAYATANINNNTAEGKIYATYYFEINGETLKVKSTDEYMFDATYTKTGTYEKEDIYIDNYGDPKYLDSNINGIFKSKKDNTTITIYQTHADKAYLEINFGNETFIRTVPITNKKIKFHEKLYESETKIEITFSKKQLNILINSSGNEILPRSLSGDYQKKKSITMDYLLEERLK